MVGVSPGKKMKTMKSFFNTANANPDLKPPPIREGEHSAAPRAAAAGEAPKDPLTMLDQLREKLSYNGREYEDSYEHVKPLADFWKILSRRSTGQRRHDLIENRRLQLPCRIPDTIVFDNNFPKPLWLHTEEGLLLKKDDFEIGDVYKQFEVDRMAVLRTYQDDVDTKKHTTLPVAVMKTAQGRCNSVKLMYGNDFRDLMEEFLKQRFDMPTTVIQKYVKARGGYNHIIRVVWRRDMPIQKYIVRNQIPMSQGCFYAKLNSGNKNKRNLKVPVPDRSKKGIERAKSPKKIPKMEGVEDGEEGDADKKPPEGEKKPDPPPKKKPEFDEEGAVDVVPTKSEAYASLDGVMRQLLVWLGTEAGLEFDDFVCDFIDADEDDVVERTRKDSTASILPGAAAGGLSLGSGSGMGGFQLTGVYGPKAPKKKAKIDLLQLLQVRAFKIRPSKRFGYALKIEKKLDSFAFKDKLMHTRCGVCDCSYLPNELPHECHTLTIQDMFEQANRLGLHFSWNATTLSSCARDASNYTLHRVCRGCWALVNELRQLFDVGEKYAQFFQEDSFQQGVRSCAQLPRYFPNVRVRKAHATVSTMPENFELDHDLLKTATVAPVEPVSLMTFKQLDELQNTAKVYSFKEPMLRYRLIFYFRQATGIPERYKNCNLDLQMEVFENVVTIPLVSCRDPGGIGNLPGRAGESVPETARLVGNRKNAGNERITNDEGGEGPSARERAGSTSSKSEIQYRAPEGSLIGRAYSFKAFHVMAKTQQGLVQWAREHQKMKIFLRADGQNVAAVYVPMQQLALERALMKSFKLPFKQGAIGYTNLDISVGITGGDVFDAVYTPKRLYERFLYLPPPEFSLPEPLPDAWLELLLNDLDPGTVRRAHLPTPDSLSQRIIEKIHVEDAKAAGHDLDARVPTPTDDLVAPAESNMFSTERISTDESFFASSSRPGSVRPGSANRARPGSSGAQRSVGASGQTQTDQDNRVVYTGSSSSARSRSRSGSRSGAASSGPRRPQSAIVESSSAAAASSSSAGGFHGAGGAPGSGASGSGYPGSARSGSGTRPASAKTPLTGRPASAGGPASASSGGEGMGRSSSSRSGSASGRTPGGSHRASSASRARPASAADAGMPAGGPSEDGMQVPASARAAPSSARASSAMGRKAGHKRGGGSARGSHDRSSTLLSTNFPPASSTDKHGSTEMHTLSHYDNLMSALDDEEEEDEDEPLCGILEEDEDDYGGGQQRTFGHGHSRAGSKQSTRSSEVDDRPRSGGARGAGRHGSANGIAAILSGPGGGAATAQPAEPLFLEGTLRALHNVGRVGEKWYVSLDVLQGLYSDEVQTDLTVGPRIDDTFERQVIGRLNLRFCIKLEALTTESLEYMRRALLRVTAFKHDVLLPMANISPILVDKRHAFGSVEFDNLGHHQVRFPNAHLFGAFYLRRAHEVDPAVLRKLSASLVWNAAYKKFETKQDLR